MSLINEALKKAQKQRTQEVSANSPSVSPPTPESTPTRRVVKRSQPMPAQTLVIVGGACLVIVGVVAAGFWFLIGPTAEIAQAPAPLVVGSAKPASSAATTATTSAGNTPAAGSSAPATTTAAATPSTQQEPNRTTGSSSTAPTTPGATPAVTPTPVGGVASLVFDVKMVDKKSEGTAPANESARSPSDPNPAVVEGTSEGGALHIDVPASEAGFVPPNSRSSAIVDGLRISGIRASATDAKVLMNERVYRLNDVVDHAIGLRLKEINANNLVFIDETGATYVRNF